MSDAFPHRPSVVAGDELVLHVSTAAHRFRVDFYRWEGRMALAGRSGWLPGRRAPHHLPYQDWAQDCVGLHGEPLEAWPAYRFTIPAAWRSGVYIAVVVPGGDGDGDGPDPDARTPDARRSRALFVVASPTPGEGASIAYKLPLLTYHAYNRVCPDAYDSETRRGSWSLYTVPAAARLPAPVPPSVCLHRPGGGTGGTPSDCANFDPFDPTPRQTFVHWDAPFVGWLERNGYRVDYCTDLDLHEDAGLARLGRYRLLLSAGHDEYWSDEMRAHVERFVQAGGNVAFFGGNTCWWRVEFDDPFTFRRTGEWSDPAGPDRPENSITGVSFRNGGERDRDDHPVPVGFRVQHCDHWVYDGTGLRDGDVFGDRPGEYLVGYECDGAHFDRSALARGAPARPTGDDGTPPGFTILGVGDVAASGWGAGNRAATFGVHTSNGTVFTAATTDWPRLLAGRPHPAVDRITRNVLDRLS